MFGKIKNQEMHLSPIGEIVQQEWDTSFEMRAELFCDGFVIMPNHIHAILRIKNGLNTVPANGPVSANGPVTANGTVSANGTVETHGRASLQSSNQPQSKNKNHGVAYRPPKSISSFIAGFKSAATKRINLFCKKPRTRVWQPRFHDHIIRNSVEYHSICNYIKNNPANCEQDQLFKREK